MSAKFAPTAAPTNALLMWTDTRYIYVELPTAAGLPPCILSFPFREQGLSRALDLLRTKATDTAGLPQLSYPKAAAYKSPTATLAESILRRRGIIK